MLKAKQRVSALRGGQPDDFAANGGGRDRSSLYAALMKRKITPNGLGIRGMFAEGCRPWLILFAAGALALVLRLLWLSRYGFDGDEIFSLQAAGSTWGHLLVTAVNDKSHPPLFYAALKLWLMLFPANETQVRLLSVLFGTALIPVAFAICRRLELAEADLAVVIVLIAVNGELIYYAQHTRMFPLFELSSGISILAIVYFLQAPVSWRVLVLLTVANSLMVYSHYWGWLAIAAQLMWVLLCQRAKVGAFVGSSLVVAVVFAPWAIAVAAALDQGGATAQIAWMGTDVGGLSSYAALLGTFNGEIDFAHATTFGIILFLAPVAALFLRHLKREMETLVDVRSPGGWTILVAVPLMLTSLGSYLARQSVWGTRHLSMVAVPYLVLVGLSMTQLSNPGVKKVLRCVILGWAVTAGIFSLAETDKDVRWEDIARGIVLQDPVPVYAAEPFVRTALEFHFKHSAAKTVAVSQQPSLGKIPDNRFWFVYRTPTGRGAAPEAQLAAYGDYVEKRLRTRSERRGRERQEITALLIRPDRAN